MNGCSLQQVLRRSFGLVFVLRLENAFLGGFMLKPTERAYILLKKVLGIFKIDLRLKDRYVFM